MGVASYYHPEGGTLLSSQGLIRSMHRSEGSLSLEFATQEGTRSPPTWWRAPRHLATGQWEAITTVEGSGRPNFLDELLVMTQSGWGIDRLWDCRGTNQ